MRAWTILLPHCLFAWLARRHCEVFDTQTPMGRVVQPLPGVLLRINHS